MVNVDIALFKNSMDASEYPIVITDSQLEEPGPKIVYANPAICKLTGYTERELLGQTPRIFQGPETSKRTLTRLKENLKNNKPFFGQTVNYKKNGEPYYISWSISPVVDKNGEIHHYVAIQNIQMFNVELQKLRAGNENAPIGFGIVNEHGYFTYINQSYCDILGYDKEEIVYKRFQDITYVEDLNEDLKQAEAVKNGEIDSYNIKKRYIKKNGDVVWVYLYVTGFYINKKFQCYLVNAIDLSDEIKITKALEVANKKLDQALNVAKIGIWEWDIKTNKLLWNNEMFEMYEVDKNTEPSYKIWEDKIIEKDKEATLKNLERAVKEDTPFDCIFRIKCKTGHKHIKAVGQVIGPGSMIGSNIDISEIVQAQEKLKQSNEELERFAYLASHDLQEPLRSITGYLQLIENRYKHKLDKDGKEFINFAVDGAKKMRKLISDLLDLSRIKTKSKPLQPVKPNETINQVIKLFQNKLKSVRGQVIVGNIDCILADENQFGQVIQNLISNSIKFRDHKRNLIIKINSRKEDNKVVIEYEDNGIGISEINYNKIFDIFKRLNHQDHDNGTGIGLAICKKIMERHNGQIEVQSVEGEWTKFSLTFQECSNA